MINDVVGQSRVLLGNTVEPFPLNPSGLLVLGGDGAWGRLLLLAVLRVVSSGSLHTGVGRAAGAHPNPPVQGAVAAGTW